MLQFGCFGADICNNVGGCVSTTVTVQRDMSYMFSDTGEYGEFKFAKAIVVASDLICGMHTGVLSLS